jgi:hypothetical protein
MVQDISLSEVKKKKFKKIRKCSVKPVLAIIGSLNLKKKKFQKSGVKPVLAPIGSLNLKKKTKIRCETGSGFYREFNF